MSKLSPCAAAASRLIKSGMTLTQIYSQYATVYEQLLVQKEENRKLELYVTTIVKEIEEKAPILKQQRLDYEKAVSNVESLTQQMDAMIVESNLMHKENVEAKKTSAHLARENQRLKKELADLARQVCYLVKTVEAGRGGSIPDLDGSHESYEDINKSSAQRVISKKLVTFSSVEDLQENNQKLLALVRQLSARLEEAETVSAADYNDLKTKEEKLERRIADVMDEMGRQSKMLDLIKNQSLRYKTLYEQTLGKSTKLETLEPRAATPVKGSPTIVTSTPKPMISNVVDMPEHQTERVKELEDALNKSTAEHKDKLREMETKLTEEIRTLKTESRELLMTNSRLVTQAEVHDEKTKVLEANIKLYKKQMEALEEKNRNLGEISARHEQAMVHSKDEAMRAQSALSRMEVALDNLREENYLLKSAEQRLVKEKEAWHRGQHSHAILMSSLDSVKATLARSEAEGKLRLELQLSETLKECTALRNSLQDEKDRFKELVSSLERQTATAKARMLEEKQLADKAREELVGVKEELTAKNGTIEELRGKLRDVSNEPTKSTIETVTMNLDASTKKIKDLEKKLAESQAEVSGLQKLLQAAKLNSAQYAEMSDTLEKQLADIRDEEAIFRKLMTEKLEDSVRKENALKKKYDELEAKCDSLTKNQQNRSEELTARLVDSNSELKFTSTELTALKTELCRAGTELQAARDQISQLNKSLEEAESKYVDQVKIHSTDIQVLAAAKEKLQQVTQTVEGLKQERDDALEVLRLKTEAWSEKEVKAAGEVNQLNARLAELDQQNAILHEKIQELGSQIAILQAQVADGGQPPVETTVTKSAVLEGETQDQLLKVVKFIRHEKDVALAKCEVLNAENSRIKSQLNLTLKKLEEANEASKSVRESESEVSMKASAKHAELLRKIDTLNALTDSNRMLREERDKFKAELAAVREEMITMEARMKESLAEQRKATEKLEALTTENQGLLIEAAKWKQKANALSERTYKATPEDWKRLTTERENLAKQWQLEKNNNEKLEEEVTRTKEEKNALNAQLMEARKNLQNETNEVRRLTDECTAGRVQLGKVSEELSAVKTQVMKLTADMTKLTEDVNAKDVVLTDLREKEMKLKKIAKKYKHQYEELLKTREEDKKKQEEEARKRSEEEAAKSLVIPNEAQEKLREEGRTEMRTELTARMTEAEAKLNEKIKELEGKAGVAEVESESLRKDNEHLKTSINEKEERAKQVMKTARSKIVQLQEQKTGLEEELGQTRAQLQQSRDEIDVKMTNLKAQYDSIITAMEKDKKDQAAERERLSSFNKSLSQRIAHQQRLLEKQQGVKPSTSSRPVEKSTMEPPTANIKPMAGSSTTAVARKQQKQPTVQQPFPLGMCWRMAGSDTPFASIRPISMQSRTVAVLPNLASNSQPPATQSTPVMVPPQQQAVHTTGSSAEALSSSPTSSHTDYMPATSSAPAIRQVVVAPTPLSLGPPIGSDVQSTQEMEAEANDNDLPQQTGPGPSSQQQQHAQQPQQTQAVALVLPRERADPLVSAVQASQQPSVDQSGSQASSSSTVTTTQAGLKRPRDVEGDSSTGLENEEKTKRSRVAVTGSGSQAEVFHHLITHSHMEGIDVEYQVPTSSQRDQEDDLIIMVDSEEEGNADDGEVEEPDDEQEFEEEDNGEGYVGMYSRDVQVMVTYDEGPDIDEENVPDQDNNEVEIIDDSNEVPNQSGGNSGDGGSDNGTATQSNTAAVPVASSVDAGSASEHQQAQQSSEATSSGSVSTEQVVVSHAASSQSSQFRTRPVLPLGRQQQSQLMLPQVYDEGGDDGIVPCTPTLYVPRRADGFGEAVSSPQVPHQVRFTFSDPNPPITRSGLPPASGEALEEIVDEAGTGRSVPTTPLQASPQEHPAGEVGQSSSGTGEVDVLEEGVGDAQGMNIPNITVTIAEEDAIADMPPIDLESAGEDEEAMEKGDDPEVVNLDDENDGVTSEGEKPLSSVEEIEEGREAEASDPLWRPTGRVGGTARRSTKAGYPRRGVPRRPTPIVWNEPGSSSSSGVGSAFPSGVRTNVLPGRMLTPDQQRQVQRNMRMTRLRHRSWK